MRHIHALVLFLCWFVGLSTTAPAQPGQPLEAPLFVEAVVKAHPSLRKAEHRVQAAHFGVKASGLQPNPSLTLAATVGDPGESANALTQSFEISGQPGLRRSIAQAQLAMAENQAQAIRKDVQILAYSVWVQLWRTQRRAELAELRTLLLQDMARVARRRFEVGEISENESLRVELAVAQAQTQKNQATAEARAALGEALLFLGEDKSLDLTNPVEPKALMASTTRDEILSLAEEHPAIQALLAQHQALRTRAELIGKERAPSLNLSIYRSDLLRTNSIEQGAQLSLSWPIFDWGSIANRKKQQEASSEAFLASIAETVLKNRQSLTRSWENLVAAQENQEILSAQAARYEELAREARIGYDVGILGLADVLQTENAFRQASVQLIEAKASVFQLELQILSLTGIPLPQSSLPKEML